jgi:hypothetical protein
MTQTVSRCGNFASSRPPANTNASRWRTRNKEDPDSFLFIEGRGIRIRDMYCGEWEMSERDGVRLTVGQARRVACALLAAAEEYERFLSPIDATA